MSLLSKKKILGVVTFLSVLLVIMAPMYVFAAIVPCSGSRALGEPAQPGGGCDFTDVIALIKNIVKFLVFSLAVPLAAISFAIAGVMILTAGGNTGQVEKAKEIFWNVLWGLIVALSAWLVVNAILLGLGASGLASLQYPLYL